MSRFCGKCDVFDTLIEIWGLTDESDWNKVKIYQKGEKLDIKCVKDLVPYYAHLIGSACYSKDDCSINITQESFIDREERESLQYKLDELKRIYRRYKRKKEEFVPEKIVEQYGRWYSKDLYLELAKRVKEHPVSAKIDGLHDTIHQWYREELYQEMLKYGYSEEYSKKWIYH